MTNLQALILGFIQGVTEYIPVSSSSHLIFIPKLLGFTISAEVNFIATILLQLGTLVGIIAYFRRDLLAITRDSFLALVKRDLFFSENSRVGYFLVVATIPAGIAGLFLQDTISYYFSVDYTFSFLLITAALLAFGELIGKQRHDFISFRTALLMGFFQIFALLPGISRSGATIAIAMVLGATRVASVKFSFLMSIPIMLGASFVALIKVIEDQALLSEIWLPLLLGFLAAAAVGYFVIGIMMNFIKKNSLLWFSLYCTVIGVLGITTSL